MIDKTLRECPFCGNPAEVIDTEPFEWCPYEPVKMIRCMNEFGCPGHKVNIRFHPNNEYSMNDARAQWNRRKRKNKITWADDYKPWSEEDERE